MSNIRKRAKKDGTTSFRVCWRDPATGKEQGIIFFTEVGATTLKRLLDANKQSFEIAQQAIVQSHSKVLTVAAVIEEHIDLLVRPLNTRRLRRGQECKGFAVRTYRSAIRRGIRQ